MHISFTDIVKKTVVAGFLSAMAFTAKGQSEMNLSLLSGVSFSTIAHSFYAEQSIRMSNATYGVELEYGFNKLHALSIGILHSERGLALKQQADICYRYCDIPLTFIHHLPFNEKFRLSFRIGLTPMFISRNNDSAKARSFLISCVAGISVGYEFIRNWRLFVRGEYARSLQSVHEDANVYFDSNGKLSEGKVLFGISYNLKPDPLRKKERKIPECLK